MKVIRTLDYTITIKTKDLFNPDHYKVCMDYLNSIFIKKNYSGMHIIEIRKILQISALRIKNNTRDVKFIAVGIVYNSGEIIYDCKVFTAEKNIMRATKSDRNIGVFINNPPIPYELNEHVPIIVSSVTYDLNGDRANMIINGRSFMKTNMPSLTLEKHYKIIAADQPEDDNLEFYMNEIENLKLEIKKSDPKLLRFAESLFDLPTKSDAKSINPDTLEPGNLVVIKNRKLYKSDIKKQSQIEEKTADFIKKLLISLETQYYSNISGFLKTYNLDDIQNRKSLWNQYNLNFE